LVKNEVSFKKSSFFRRVSTYLHCCNSESERGNLKITILTFLLSLQNVQGKRKILWLWWYLFKNVEIPPNTEKFLFEVKVLNHNLRNCRTIFDPIDIFFMEMNKLSFLPVIALTKIIHGLHLGRNKLYSFQSFYREI